MSSVVSFGTNTNAQRKRVKFVNSDSSSSITIYEGQPMCYQFDTTTNVLGVDRYDGSASTTTTDGYQNEGKFLIVDVPYGDNVEAFAGVVAHGSWCGKTVADDGELWIELFVPNGAIVPVRADQDCTPGRTILAVHTAEQALTAPHAANARPVAIAWEDYTRSASSPGLVLAKLDPNIFIWQAGDATELLVDDEDGGPLIVNKMHIETAQTSGRFTAFEIITDISGTPASTGYGLTLYTETDVNGIITGQNAGVSHWTNFAGTTTHAFSHYYGVEIGIYESGDNLGSITALYPLCLRVQLDSTNGAPANSTYMMYLRSDGAGDQPDGLFCAYDSESIAGAAVTSGTTCTHHIPIKVEAGGGDMAAGTYYLMVKDTA